MLPRNLQNVPFPEHDPLHKLWPNGFNCGSECLLNAVWTAGRGGTRTSSRGDSNPGLTATRDVVGDVLGLRIDYYTIIDLAGFQGLVNAMGGVYVNVRPALPIGGSHDANGHVAAITG